MKRLVYPLALVFASLLFAAIFTAVTAMTLASYAKNDANQAVVKTNLTMEKSTASR